MGLSGTRRDLLKWGAAAFALRGFAQGSGARFGAAEAPITPSWSTMLWGYGTDRFSSGKRDDIFAKAFLFESGGRFLLVTLDVGALDFALTRGIARRVHEATGLPEDSIAVQCTHTHYAPAVIDTVDMKGDQRFRILMADRIVEIAKQAVKNLAPAAFEFGQVDSYIGLNRRTEPRVNDVNQKSGDIDPVFSVLVARSPERKNLGVLVNYPSHPVMLPSGPLDDKISADFPGVMYQELGASLHCPVMFSQGCCGDIVPKAIGTEERMIWYGKKMASEAQRAIAAAKPIAAPVVSYSSRRVPMTFVAPYDLEDMQQHFKDYTKGGGYFELWGEQYRRYLEDGGDTRQTRDTLVETFNLGDISFAFLPGEVLHLTSVFIRRDFPGRKLVVAGYSNDTSIGYVPYADEFPKGGYEVNNAWRFYGILKTTPDMERGIRETAEALLKAQ